MAQNATRTGKRSIWKRAGGRLDSFINAITGIGSIGRDKRLAGVPAVVELSPADEEDLYRGDDMAARIAETLVDEMFRKGFGIAIEDDRELAELFDAQLEDLNARKHLKEALIWSRVFGGGAVFIGADDGSTDLSKPLNLKAVKSVNFLMSLEKQELIAEAWYSTPGPKYGLPSVYRLQPQAVAGSSPSQAGRVLIHESRLLIFDGVLVTRRQRVRNQGWGDSIYTRVFEVLRDFGMTWAAASHLLTDWAQGVYKIHGLNELVAGAEDDVVLKRLQWLDQSRSVARAVVLDAGTNETPAEDFKREMTSLAGLPEILTQFALRLAAAARMPVTMLFGQAPAGLNATGEQDRKWFDDQVAAKQIEILLPPLQYLTTILFAAKQGPARGVEPKNWSVHFAPLSQLSALEEADRRLKIAQSDQIYLETGCASPEEVAASRFGGDAYNGDKLEVDFAARDKMATVHALATKPDPSQPPQADK